MISEINRISALTGVLACLSSPTLFAGTMGPAPAAKTVIAALSLGPAWLAEHRNQTLFLTPEIVKTYTVNQSSAVFSGELLVGIQRNWMTNTLYQLGLAYVHSSNAKIAGEVWDDADPLFNNYSYRFNINHNALLLKGKLLRTEFSGFMPWLSAGIGFAWNQAASFSSTPLIFEAVPTPPFMNDVTMDFTYTLGIGIQKQFRTHWQAGVGYEFSDWGKSQLGSAVGQYADNGLGFSHTYSNALMFNVTYLA